MENACHNKEESRTSAYIAYSQNRLRAPCEPFLEYVCVYTHMNAAEEHSVT